jgi:protein-disulfide isomerase
MANELLNRGTRLATLMKQRIGYATLFALAFVSMGASCSGGSSETATGAGSSGSSERPPNITEIPGVELDDLTPGERRIWASLVNDLLSPCGEPVSVARCATGGSETSCRTCVPAARYVARLMSEGWERSEIEEAYESRYGRDTTVDLPLEDHPIRGAPMARVTIAEFSDFECPYCGRAYPIVEELLREYPGEIRVVFFNYPLSAHPHAMPAARAAVAAGNQGKFWEMHDLLFNHQTQLTDEDLDRYATQLELDLERFHADLRSAEVQANVEADRELGRRLDVDGTPTFFINGRRFREGPQALPAYIREELEL